MSSSEYVQKKIAAVRSNIDLSQLPKVTPVDQSRWYAEIGIDDGERRERLLMLEATTLEDAVAEVAGASIIDYGHGGFDFTIEDGEPDWGNALKRSHCIRFISLIRICEMHRFDVEGYLKLATEFQSRRDAESKEANEREQYEKLKAKFEGKP